MLRRHVSVGSALMFDLCLVMAVAAFGGLRVGLVASVGAFGLTNWFLTPPLHTVTVGDAENVVALSVFVLVTFVVSFLVDRAARRFARRPRLGRRPAALARSAATLVGAHDPLPDLLEQLRATFGLDAASVFELTGQGWWPTHVSGHPELLDPTEGTSIDISADGKLRLVVSTNALRAGPAGGAASVRRPTGDGSRGTPAPRRRRQRRSAGRGQRPPSRVVASGLSRLPHSSGDDQGVGVRFAAHRSGVLRVRSPTVARRHRRCRRQT